MLLVRLNYSSELSDPCLEEGQWKLYSFSTRHPHFKLASSFDVEVTRNEVLVVNDSSLKTKLDQGLAYWLSFYDHGNVVWFRKDGSVPPGVEFQYDGVRVAGLLIWPENYSVEEMRWAKNPESRIADVDLFLRRYTDWMNGFGYDYDVVNPDTGEVIDRYSGIYACQAIDMLEDLATVLGSQEFSVTGTAAEFLEPDLRVAVANL